MRLLIGVVLTLTLGLFFVGCKGNSADSTTTNNIKSELAKDTTLNGRDISVDTDNGVVTVSGTVNTEAERMRVVQIARGTEGVKRVDDKLEVDSTAKTGENQPSNSDNSKASPDNSSGYGTNSNTSDSTLESQVKAKLSSDKNVTANDINVDVKDGVATLTAKKGTHPDLKRAAEIARSVNGVKSVNTK
ncbi:MAG TPA: BON domain-containing protein [Blastocatellia bacterium]|nr:BON domain-containing protein [Blastocatellia bacterium]